MRHRRPALLRRVPLALAALLAAVPLLAAAADGETGWRSTAPLPLERTEVAAARVGGEILVAGGFLADGSSSGRVDAYAPSGERWRRLPDLPQAVHHAAAASFRGRLYVLGGYAEPGRPSRAAFVLERGGWRRLPAMPEPRAAAGAAIVAGKLYVVGGMGGEGTRRLARRTLVLDLARRRWSTAPGPTPREHLAVTALEGRVYALAGRTAGIDTNLDLLESLSPGARRWERLPPIPQARGGTGAAALGGSIVSAGGEEPRGTIASVYAYTPRTRAWRRLADLPTPRHGLGVVALDERVYAIAGGPRPGLFVSGATEYLSIP